MLLPKLFRFYYPKQNSFSVFSCVESLFGIGFSMSFAISLSNMAILFTPQGLQKQVGELESQASPRGSGLSSLSLLAFFMVY